ncbi:MAG: YdiU family protein [Halioglobus sp.]
MRSLTRAQPTSAIEQPDESLFGVCPANKMIQSETMTTLAFDNSYAHLPARLYSHTEPTPVAEPGLIRINTALAKELGIDPDWLGSQAGIAVLAGNAIPAGAEPIATAYAGHQFGGWNPQLGDGRAVLLGEIIDPGGQRFDFQLKGSGPTPWSRGGDGRSPIGPVLREYVVSEAMAVLGVPTTRALAAVTTGEQVYRDQAMPGAILARIASSHIRIGTFQFFAARKDTEALELLVEQVINRHYPDAADSETPALAMLEAAIAAQASLVARWQLLGFIHGVMNTDNMLLSGETVDYGPCAFIDNFHPDTVFSSIDQNGRYAYRNQPAIAHWNLANLAQSLVPLLHTDQEIAVQLAQTTVDGFPQLFMQRHIEGMNQKLGLEDIVDGDEALAQDLLTVMTDDNADFTLSFRYLSEACADRPAAGQSIEDLYSPSPALLQWMERWRERLARNSRDIQNSQTVMYTQNPAFIPRNHLVEEVIQAATRDQDLAPFHQLVDVLGKPFDYTDKLARYATPPQPDQVVKQTFCGT